MSETVQEKKEEIQTQGQSQLIYDPDNPDPSRRRAQIALLGGEEPKKDDEEHEKSS